MKLALLALSVILVLGLVSVGGTFAVFSDSETSYDNYIETGSLDLKVAQADDLEFCDDQPWGTGLFLKEIDTDEFEIVPCFKAEEDGVFADSYPCNLKLWNAGCVEHGKVYVHIRDVVAQPEGLLSQTNVTIWYDQDNDGDNLDSEGEIDEAEVVVGTLEVLAWQPVPLEPVVWLLPAAGEWRNLEIVIDPPQGSPGNSLTFNIQFGLIGIFFTDDDIVDIGFCDTEVCLDNYLKVKAD